MRQISAGLLADGFVVLLVIGGSHAPVTAIPDNVAVEETGTIAARAVDSIGKPVSGVSVTIVAESGGVARHATTGSDGTCRFGVPAGMYRVDFETLGFDVTRRNHVRVRHHGSTSADGVLHLSAICECVAMVAPNALAVRSGAVVDDAGRPLPHARLEVDSPMRREVAYADADGRFLLKVPVDTRWPVTASDTGHRPVTQHVSGSVAGAIMFTLAHAGTTNVPDDERLSRACRCPDDLFTHSGR